MTKKNDSKLKFSLVLGWLLCTPAIPAWCTDYYISATGNDANAGTSPSSAWKTISKANALAFKAGDRLLFEAGKTFSGTLQLNASDGGLATNPLQIGSYGAGRAILDGGAGSGVVITNATGIQISNLTLIGSGRKTGNKQGVGVSLSGAKNITVDQIEASGFQRAGVDFYNSSDVRLTQVYTHDNGFAGISCYAATNVYVGYCRAINNPGDPTITNNHSGNGIVLSGKNMTVEYCEAAENGWDMQQVNSNGPVGIWCYDADRVTIQYCISHNNKSPKADGGGFDFDGGVTNSVIQYNYAYENKNYGYLAWEYGSPTQWTNNTFRYNISVNNSGPGLLCGTSGGQGVNNCEVYNNLFYNASYPAVTNYGGAVNFKFRNNIFVGPGSASLVVTGNGYTYQGNCYWFTSGNFNVGGYGSLAAWANATGQEKVNGAIVGLHADPKLQNPTNYEKLTDPTKLPTLTAFLVPAGSPVIDKGLDLKTLFGIDAGTRDFYGHAIPAGSSVDIGVQEVGSTGTPAPPPPPVSALVVNPGLEADAAPVAAPQGWNTWAGSQGTGADADYTETYGGAHGGSYHGTHYKTSNYEVYTYQTINGLTNGLYTLRAWVKGSGGQTYALMLAKNYGGSQVSVSVGATAGGTSGAWNLVELKNINVTNGKCEIGFYSLAAANQWLYFDDVTFVKQSSSARTLNPEGFTSLLSLTLALNPAQERVTISFTAESDGEANVTLQDLMGRQVLRTSVLTHAGTNQVRVPITGLAEGLYLVTVIEGHRRRTEKLRIAP